MTQSIQVSSEHEVQARAQKINGGKGLSKNPKYFPPNALLETYQFARGSVSKHDSEFSRKFKLDKQENPSTRGIPNKENMPTEKLVSGDSTLQQKPLHKLKPFSKNHFLTEQLQAELESSMWLLKADPSPANAERVSLLVLERISALVWQTVDVPVTPTSSGVRQMVFTIYDRLATLLGRNSPEAVKADTSVRLQSLGEKISFRPGVGNKQKTNPCDHIQNVIVPQLDADMVSHAYYQNMYHFPTMKNFHTLIGMWRSRGEDLGKIKASK